MIVYINTKSDRTTRVVSDLGEIMGVGAAQGIVNRWFNDYNEFVYNSETGDLLLYKKAYSGYWEAIDKNLTQMS
jgi:hypothetical protein